MQKLTIEAKELSTIIESSVPFARFLIKESGLKIIKKNPLTVNRRKMLKYLGIDINENEKQVA